MTSPFFRSKPTQWSELYRQWLAYSEAENEERKNGWKPESSSLLATLTGRASPSSR